MIWFPRPCFTRLLTPLELHACPFDTLLAVKVTLAMIRPPAQSRLRTVLRRPGFTLTEVLLVLAILGVIAAMVVPNLLGRQKEALRRSSLMSIKSMEDACKQYAIAHDGEFPSGSRDDVIGLLINPGQDKDGKPVSPYLEKAPKDAWDQLLYYEYPSGKVAGGTRPAIWSSGPDKKNDEGNNDDVNNWSS